MSSQVIKIDPSLPETFYNILKGMNFPEGTYLQVDTDKMNRITLTPVIEQEQNKQAAWVKVFEILDKPKLEVGQEEMPEEELDDLILEEIKAHRREKNA